MNKNVKTIALSSLAMILLLPLVGLASSEIVLPDKGQKMSAQESRDYTSRDARRLNNQSKSQELRAILEKNDYQAWLEFVADKDCPMKGQVSEENFSDFVLAHQERWSEREARQENRGRNRR